MRPVRISVAVRRPRPDTTPRNPRSPGWGTSATSARRARRSAQPRRRGRPCPSVSPGRKLTRAIRNAAPTFMPRPPGESSATYLPNGLSDSPSRPRAVSPDEDAIPICSGGHPESVGEPPGCADAPPVVPMPQRLPGAWAQLCGFMRSLSGTIVAHPDRSRTTSKEAGGVRMDKQSFLERARPAADIGTGKESEHHAVAVVVALSHLLTNSARRHMWRPGSMRSLGAGRALVRTAASRPDDRASVAGGCRAGPDGRPRRALGVCHRAERGHPQTPVRSGQTALPRGSAAGPSGPRGSR
jgi:hypothetical protein